eukprot:1261975-Pyramimonas_sp.AAC.1
MLAYRCTKHPPRRQESIGTVFRLQDVSNARCIILRRESSVMGPERRNLKLSAPRCGADE